MTKSELLDKIKRAEKNPLIDVSLKASLLKKYNAQLAELEKSEPKSDKHKDWKTNSYGAKYMDYRMTTIQLNDDGSYTIKLGANEPSKSAETLDKAKKIADGYSDKKEKKETPKTKTDDLASVRVIANEMAKNAGFKSAKVDDLGNEAYLIEISPASTKDDSQDGMVLNKYKDGTFEVAEMQAGKGGNFINVFGEYKTLKPALTQLLKGNKQKPIKVIDMRSDTEKSEDKKEDKKETSSKKIKLKEIKIHWAEGDNSKYDKFPKMYSTWSKSNDAIIPILKDNKGDGGYNKVKFTVFYEDGETYDGRLDVSEKEDNPTKTHNVIGQHIKDFLDYELSEKSKSSAESKKEVKEWLEKYDLGLSSSKETVKSEDKKETKSEKTEEERCQEIIDKQRIASKKAKAAAKKSAKKPELTKAKEKIERTFEVIENKIEKGALTKAEVAKLIVETKEVLKMLEKALKSL